MYKSAEVYSCQVCGKSYKNSASLTSHKYKYHPYSSTTSTKSVDKEFDFDNMSSISNISSSIGVNHDLRHLSMDNQMTELDVDNLQSEIRQLRSFLNKIDTKVHLQAIVLDGIERDVKRQRVYNDTTRIARPEEASLIKDLTIDNANRIRVIEDQMTKFENAMQQLLEVGTNDAAMQDMIDDMVDVEVMFRNNNFEGLKADITKLRQSIGIMLNSLNLQELDKEDVKLLKDLSTSSKREVAELLKSNFGHLTNIFRIIRPEFEGLFKDSDISESEGLYDVDVENESEDDPIGGVVDPVQKSDSDGEISRRNSQNEVSEGTETENEHDSEDDQPENNDQLDDSDTDGTTSSGNLEGTETDNDVPSSGEENVDNAQSMQSDSQFEETDDPSDSESEKTTGKTVEKTSEFGKMKFFGL